MIFGSVYLVLASGFQQGMRLLAVGGTAVLLVFTIRTSFTLNFINYDMATEFLVYAHAGPDVSAGASPKIDTISVEPLSATATSSSPMTMTAPGPLAGTCVSIATPSITATRPPDAMAAAGCDCRCGKPPKWLELYMARSCTSSAPIAASGGRRWITST